MPDIDVLADTPANRLIFAINCYVSTGDHIGEGVILSKNSTCTIVVPVDLDSEQDAADFASLRSRVEELPRVSIEEKGAERDFTFFLLHADDPDAAATALAKRPGKKGWGSTKPFVEHYASAK